MPVAEKDPSDNQESYKQYKGEIASTRAGIVQKRKLIVTQNLQLTQDEAPKFWPLYERYRKEMTKVSDREVKLITDYADDYNNKTLTDKKAIALLKEAITIDEQRLKIKKKFLADFKQVLPPKKVVRFYQIENKMDAELDYTLARQIPLVE